MSVDGSREAALSKDGKPKTQLSRLLVGLRRLMAGCLGGTAVVAILSLAAHLLSSIVDFSEAYTFVVGKYAHARDWLFSRWPLSVALPRLLPWQKDLVTVVFLFGSVVAGATVNAATRRDASFLVRRWIATHCSVFLALAPAIAPFIVFGNRLESSFFHAASTLAGLAIVALPVAFLVTLFVVLFNSAGRTKDPDDHIEHLLARQLLPTWSRFILILLGCFFAVAILLYSPLLLFLAVVSAIAIAYGLVAAGVFFAVLVTPSIVAFRLLRAGVGVLFPVLLAAWAGATWAAIAFVWNVAPRVARQFNFSTLGNMIDSSLALPRGYFGSVQRWAALEEFRDGTVVFALSCTAASIFVLAGRIGDLPTQDRAKLTSEFLQSARNLAVGVFACATILLQWPDIVRLLQR